jgi:hypothetical protein
MYYRYLVLDRIWVIPAAAFAVIAVMTVLQIVKARGKKGIGEG